MTTAITLAGWFGIFFAYFAFAFGLAVLIGKFIAHGNRSFEDHGRPRVGLPPSVVDFTAEQKRRRHFRRTDRFRRDVA